MASERGNLQQVLDALAAGADANAGSESGAPALVWAAQGGHTEIVEALLNRGADVNSRRHDGCTALIVAAAHGHTQTVRALLARHADIKATNRTGYTALMAAESSGYEETVQVLLERQPTLAASREMNKLLLNGAAGGVFEQVAAALTAGADPNARALDGSTALYFAAFHGHVQIAKILLQHHADPNAKGFKGDTPLFWAAGGGHTEIVKALLEHGANVNANNYRDLPGATALMQAAAMGHAEIVKLLLDRGADVNARTRDGRTALSVAKDPQIRALLRAKQGANCYLVTATYGTNSREAALVHARCRQRFLLNPFLTMGWCLYKYYGPLLARWSAASRIGFCLCKVFLATPIVCATGNSLVLSAFSILYLAVLSLFGLLVLSPFIVIRIAVWPLVAAACKPLPQSTGTTVLASQAIERFHVHASATRSKTLTTILALVFVSLAGCSKSPEVRYKEAKDRYEIQRLGLDGLESNGSNADKARARIRRAIHGLERVLNASPADPEWSVFTHPLQESARLELQRKIAELSRELEKYPVDDPKVAAAIASYEESKQALKRAEKEFSDWFEEKHFGNSK